MLKQRAAPLPVVVLSGGVTGLGVLRAFARQGIPAVVHPPASDELRHSRWYRPLLRSGNGTPPARPGVAALGQALAESGLERAFLCPCSDDWNRVVAEFAERGDPRFASMTPPGAALDLLQNKARLAMLLQELDVPMPNTSMIRSSADVAELPPARDTFYFLKPTDSQSFLARFGVKGMRVPTAAEARARLEQVVAANLTVVLQEYIPGSFTEHFFIDGYVDRHGSVKALFARRRQRIYPPDFGNSTAMVSVDLQDVVPAAESVRRVLAAVDYRGIFSAEFKRDPRDGKFKLLEINARPWWFVDFAVRCGVDVCRMAYDDAQGLPVQEVSTYTVGATCIYPYYDFFAVLPLVRSGRLSWWRWATQVAHAMQPVACWDDPMPGIAGFTRVVSAALRHRLSGKHA